MEIFCRNLPIGITDDHVRRHFASSLEEFSVYTFDFQKRGRNCAILTLTDAVKAQKFIDRWKPIPSTAIPRSDVLRRAQGPLCLAGRPIYLSRSKNNPPEDLLLRYLEQKEIERLQRRPIPAVPTLQKTFAVSSMSCGSWSYSSGHAVFINNFDIQRKGSITFGRSCLKAVLETPNLFGPTYDVEFDYSSLAGPLYLPIGSAHLTFSVEFAPRLFKSSITTTLQLFEVASNSHQKKRISNFGDDSHAAVSTCFVYRITLQHRSDVERIRELRKERHLPKLGSYRTATITPTQSHKEHMDFFLNSLAREQMPYRLKYQLQMLAWNGVLPPDKVLQLFSEAQRLVKRSGIDQAAQGFRKLANEVKYISPEEDPTDFEADTLAKLVSNLTETLDNGVFNRRADRGQKNHVFIHRVTVTPVGTYLYGPDLDSENRVLRKYRTRADNFLRVHFLDENGEPIRFDRNASLDEIFNVRFKSVLCGGIPIGGRRFEFLGFSHSSLRAHLCWFMAPFLSEQGESIDARSIIPLLGNFSLIRSPAKCAARIGQTFSDTLASVPIDPDCVVTGEDITTCIRGRERIFSDGVGTLSPSLMQKIWKEYAVQAVVKPTVFQIRCAGSYPMPCVSMTPMRSMSWLMMKCTSSGAKGMISLDSTLSGDVLMLRKSMIKFDGSDSWNIEVCGSGVNPLPCFLNKPLIKILEDLGVPPSSFLDLQGREIEGLRQAAQAPLPAADFLRRFNTARSIRLPWLLKKLNWLGLHFSNDDFLRKTVQMAVLFKLRELKYRARIHVEQGLTMYGIMDETGWLQEGQVYCPVRRQEDERFAIVRHRVIITRSPALHPGDVQLADAVEVPDDSPLRRLHNCVVFSQYGVRDLPSKLSGGDLDGDLYNVIYDPQLQPERVHEAADYSRARELLLDRPVEKGDIIDFFLTFMQQDQLGRIASLHQALADQKAEGVCHESCTQLAELHSTAVDFSKSGRPVRVLPSPASRPATDQRQADMNQLPKHNKFRPDHMARGPRVRVEDDIALLQSRADEQEDEDEQGSQCRFYKSKKVLGQLYRAIDERAFLDEVQRSNEKRSTEGPGVIGAVWTYVQQKTRGLEWRYHVDMAREIKVMYVHLSLIRNSMAPRLTGDLLAMRRISRISCTGTRLHRGRRP